MRGTTLCFYDMKILTILLLLAAAHTLNAEITLEPWS